MASNGVCTDAQNSPSFQCLSRTESIGLTIVSEAGLLSLTAVSYVFAIILRNVIWRVRNLPRERLRVFHQPMDLLMFSLFFADILQAIGAVMDIRWIQEGKLEVGSFCNAQGIVQNVGETGVAMSTLVIAIYTFLGVWMGKSINSMMITRVILACVWLFIAVMVIVGNTIHRGPDEARYQSPTPYWCWISQDYMKWRIFSEYLWFWITLGFSFFVYIPLYLWLRGNIEIDSPAWWKFHFQHADKSDPEIRARRSHSRAMAAYPLVYCFNILPLSVVRWISFTQGAEVIPASATFAAGAIYGLSGFCNVLLLLSTRPNSGLFAKVAQFSSGRPPSLLLPSSVQEHDHPMHEHDRQYDREQASTQGPKELRDDGLDLGRLPSRSSGGWGRGV